MSDETYYYIFTGPVMNSLAVLEVLLHKLTSLREI